MELERHAVLRAQRAEQLLHQLAPLRRGGVVRRLRVRRQRPAQLAQHPAASSVDHDGIGRPQRAEELAEREGGRAVGPHQLVRLDVAAAVQEDVLEDAPLQRRQALGHGREAAAAVAVTEPVDREVADDGDEPGGEAGAVIGLVDIGAEPPQVVGAQGFAHLREHVHDVVVVLGVVTDRREDEAAVAVEEPVPRGFRSAGLELGDPVVHR